MILNKMILGMMFIFLGESRFLNCGEQYTSEKLVAIKLIKKTPIVNWDSTLTMFESYYTVYYYMDLTMYEFNYNFDSLFNDEPVLREIRSYFLVFHKDSSYGYTYFVTPNPPVNANQRVNKDSMLSKNKFESNIYDTLINFRPDSNYTNKEEIIRVYKNPPSANSAQQMEKYELYFHYTKKLNGVPETFSKKMDNIKGMKLTKILIKVSGGYYKEFNMTFPPRELLQEMKEVGIENTEEIMTYFRKYQEGRL